jgi:uncharacterized membrane protein YidH (DUF202 family)
MSKEVLDDWEWDNDDNETFNHDYFDENDSDNVVMLKTYNSENEAYISAAALKNEGIEAHILSSATGQMTPFAYGNVRLFVARTQAAEAAEILARIDNENAKMFQKQEVPMSKVAIYCSIGLVVLFIFIRTILLLAQIK